MQAPRLTFPMQTEEKITTTVHHRTPLQRVARVLLKIVLFLFLFVVLLFLLLLTPPVQRFATNQAERYLEKKLKTRVDIGSISIGLPRKVVLHDVYIEDQTKDTLIAGGTIRANIELFKLFSNEVRVNDLQLDDITAKVKRVLPDTAFNFQFIVDAFATQQNANADTSQTAVMKLAVSNIGLRNFNVVYKDVVTGNDMTAHINSAKARIDTLDPYTSHFSIPSLAVNGMRLRFFQNTPLLKPEPLSADLAKIGETIPMKLAFGTVDLTDVAIDYGNTESALFSTIRIGKLAMTGRDLDFANRRIHLKELRIDQTASLIRLGRSAGARVLETEAKKEVIVQQENGWSFAIDRIDVDNNSIQFDNDNKPRQGAGIDYAHFRGDSLTLHMQNLVMSGDTIMGKIAEGSFRERSGFRLDALTADFMYGPRQTYIKDLYVKTPGSEIKRSLLLDYPSLDALTKRPQDVVVDIDLANSRLQVKDIIAFVPQMRNHPALANRNAVWRLNLQGSGTLNRLAIENLQFDGLRNTSIDASGVLAGLSDPKAAGGTLTIRRFHTSQTDLSLFTGQRLSTKEIALPETFSVTGTLAGNMSRLNTNLTIASAVGNVGVNGSFANLTTPEKLRYNATIRTNSLRIGQIMRNKVPVGSITANLRVTGSGTTPATINTKFNGTVSSVGYNNYTYRNIRLDGNLKGSSFAANVDIRDPNIDLTAKASGNFATNSSFRVNGFVDSIKTMPLHFTTEPFIFRGKIDADVASLNPDYLEADVKITQALLVSGTQRLPLDTLSFVSGRTGSGQFMRLTSDIANASMEGQYRFSDLGSIIQNNIQPYFAVSKSSRINTVQPYNFTFTVDVANSPALSAFVPGLDIAEPIHASGSLATGQGLQANVRTPALVFGTNSITGLNVDVTTTPAGLQFNGKVDHLVSGNTFNVYNTRLTATALNNVIDFNLGIDDKASRAKYHLAGTLTQPSIGTYALSLRPDSLLLNYERWTVSANNQLILSPTTIGANNFVLSKGAQQLSLQSAAGNTGPLAVNFSGFRLATITGFLRSDSLLADGTLNGNITFRDLMKQPLFTSDLTISDLTFRQDTLGNLALQVSNSASNLYTTNLTLTGQGNDVQVTGTLAPKGTTDVALNLDVAIRQLQLNTFEGALAEAVSKAEGTIDGRMKVGGTLSSPDLDGSVHFNKTRINTIFLGGDFRIEDETLAINNEGLRFDNFIVRDSADNLLTLDGTVGTPNFINYYFNLNVDANNFRVLNTTKKQNKVYYGQLFLSTHLNIAGTETKPVIDGSVTIEDNTNLTVVVPQKEPGVQEREGVIQFVDMDAPGSDSLFLAAYDSLNVSGLIGYDIAANIEVKKDAMLNLVIDEANGDLLNLQGEALLTAGIDPSGKINLTGSYVLEKGAYELSFNFLHRRFEIQKGSTIVWLGEPTRATLDVKGLYIANAAPIDLVANQLEASTGELRNSYFLQKLPFEVYLNVTGEMLKPVISFDIQLPPEKSYTVSKDVIQLVDTRLAQVRQEPSEINKQVFSLLLLNRFVGDNPFQSQGSGFSAGSFARQSVSQLLTDQLNSLAGNLIQGVDINLGVVSSDDYTTGTLQHRTDLNVGLSKRLLNDRLTVSVGSNFELSGPQNSTNQRSSNLAGDISVNYQLSKDGRYMLRFYRRNEFQGVVEGYIIETGLGFSINVDYDHFREVLRGKKIALEGIDDKQKKVN
jgi:translocation and assembly module TamB